jgi:hypothetical protein
MLIPFPADAPESAALAASMNEFPGVEVDAAFASELLTPEILAAGRELGFNSPIVRNTVFNDLLGILVGGPPLDFASDGFDDQWKKLCAGIEKMKAYAPRKATSPRP